MKKSKAQPKIRSVTKRKSTSVSTVSSSARRTPSSITKSSVFSPSARQLLQVAQMRTEKCELKEARETYQLAFEIAKEQSDLRVMMESLAGLLRLAGEALDNDAMKRLEQELDAMIEAHPKQVPPMVWYCKCVIARALNDSFLAQRHIHRHLRAVRQEGPSQDSEILSYDDAFARAWVMMATILWQRGRYARSLQLVQVLLARFESRNLRNVNGMLYQLTGSIYEKQRKYDEALKWYHKAHAAFLASHSWYYHLYVLYAYARLARYQRNFSQAYWYLDLIEKASQSPEFGLLKREIALEKSRLASDAVDLLIDSRQCVIQTREAGEIALGKQYVLLHILEALSDAHHGSEVERERGLSKAEIIEKVWKEKYRPEAHDNKLYYNINRLRKLIEPDVHKPKYLVNWREGYRLAPGLKVQFIGGTSRLNEVEG